MNCLPFIFENKEAPLSDEKNTNVLFAIPMSFNFWRIVPTPSSNSRTASPYLTMKLKIYDTKSYTGVEKFIINDVTQKKLLTNPSDWYPDILLMHTGEHELNLGPSIGRKAVFLRLVFQ